VHNSSWHHCRKAKERDSQVGKECWEARRITERLAKDPVTVTLFQNMTWFILRHE
jgi:hypothetical protein